MTHEILEPDLANVTLESVLQALGDEIRIAIVRELYGEAQGRACGSFDLNVSKATRSHHFKALREAGITHTEVFGTQRLLTLRRDELEARFPGLLDAVAAAAPAAV